MGGRLPRSAAGAGDERSWLADALALPPDREVTPGLTVGDLVRFHSRPPTPDGALFTPGVVYGTAGAGGRPLWLHAYPRADAGERAPGIVFFHGGAWSGGHPFAHIRRACLLAGRGCVTATVSYRLTGEATWPAALEDAKCAVRWMRANATVLGVDRERIVAVGDSAGGHLAAMVALTPGRFEGQGGNAQESSAVQGAVLFCPATDLRLGGDAGDAVARFLGHVTQDRLAEASPVTHVSAAAPPILTMAGAEDEVIPVATARAFHASLDACGVDNELVVYDGWRHGFDWHPDAWTDSFERLRLFVETRFPPPSRRFPEPPITTTAVPTSPV